METSQSAQSLIASTISTCSTAVSTVAMDSSSSFDSNTPTVLEVFPSYSTPNDQPTRFYIGDFESSSELSSPTDEAYNSTTSTTFSSIPLIGNRIALGAVPFETISSVGSSPKAPKHVMLSINNSAYKEDNDDSNFSIDAMTKLMSESTKKMTGKNSFDSGYGIIINGNNNNRFISCDSQAAMIMNQEYDPELGVCGKDSDSGVGDDAALSGSFSSATHSGLGQILSCRALLIVIAQVFMAIIFSAGGNFGAGLILDKNQKWEVFNRIPELFYLVPTLLGLKGNLEMTMVARLSTMANMGKMNSWKKICWAALTNLSTVQSQATLISILASAVTFVIAFFAGNPSMEHAGVAWQEHDTDGNMIDASAHPAVKVLVIFSTSLCTANVACFASSILMILLIVLFSNLNLNPDNFATAVAASFGDIVTSWLLCDIGQYIYMHTVYTPENALLDGIKTASIAFYQELRTPYLAIAIIVGFCALFPVWVYFACRNKHTRAVLLGVGAWAPILVAMCISFVSGFFLRFGASMFAFMALFQPLINGVGGNLAAITTSRMSTELHQTRGRHDSDASLKSVKSVAESLQFSLRSFLSLKDHNNIMMAVFLIISLSVQLAYGYMLPVVNNYGDRATFMFYVFYAAASTCQVLILLLFTRILVHRLWDMGLDPDTCAIPILTAIGDLLGTLFLLFILMTLQSMGNQSAFSAVANEDAVHVISASVSTYSSTMASTTYQVVTDAPALLTTLMGQASTFVTYSAVH